MSEDLEKLAERFSVMLEQALPLVESRDMILKHVHDNFRSSGMMQISEELLKMIDQLPPCSLRDFAALGLAYALTTYGEDKP